MLRLLLLLACAVLASPAGAETLSLRGEVTYREAIALPAGASLTVRLVDLGGDVDPHPIEAEARIAPVGQQPLTFVLRFDRGTVIPGREYGIVADITAGGQRWFTTPQPQAIDPLSASEPGIVLSFAGRIADTSPLSEPPAELFSTEWTLLRVNGGETSVGTLVFASDMRASGRTACNDWFAPAHIRGEAMRFFRLVVSRTMCADDEARKAEQDFLHALDRTRYWQLSDEGLVLLDATGLELAVLTSTH